MYSILVRYFPDIKYYNVAIKENGIDESSRNLRLHIEKKTALLDFKLRAKAITCNKKSHEE